MAAFRCAQTVDLNNAGNGEARRLTGYVGDALAHVWAVTLTRNNAAEDLTGYTAMALHNRPDGATLEITATITGNVVTVTLPQASYVYAGQGQPVLLRLSKVATGEETIVAGLYLNVSESETGTPTDPGTSIATTLSGLLASEAARVVAEGGRATAESARVAAEATRQLAIVEKTGYGVLSGLGVTAQGSPNMTVAVAAGVAYMSNGTRFTPAAVASQAITAADATNPRIDIIYLSSAGAITYLAGMAAASPSAPSTPAGGLLLAEISVAVSQTTIQTANITDRRKPVTYGDYIYPTLQNAWVKASGEYVRYAKGNDGMVDLEAALTGGSLSTTAFTVAAGYRPAAIVSVPGTGGASAAQLYPAGTFLPSAGSGTFRFRMRYKAEA